MTDNTERDNFERWYRSVYPANGDHNTHSLERAEDDDGNEEDGYLARFTNGHWEAFQLGRAQDAGKDAEIATLRAQVAAGDALRKAVDDVPCDIADWGAYAGEYFQKKHGLQDDIERYTKALDAYDASKTAPTED